MEEEVYNYWHACNNWENSRGEAAFNEEDPQIHALSVPESITIRPSVLMIDRTVGMEATLFFHSKAVYFRL